MTNLTPEAEQIIEAVKEQKTAANELVAQGLSPQKVIAMQNYAFRMRGKYPKMNPNRIKQMVAKKFNLKII